MKLPFDIFRKYAPPGALWICGLALLLAGCNQSPPPKILARVGDQAITVEDFQKEVDRRRKAKRPLPEKAALLEEMITYQALLRQARQTGLDQDPEIQREINNLLISKLRDRDLAPRLENIEVTTEEIKAEYDRNSAKYTQPAKVRLALLFLKTEPMMSDGKKAEVRARLQEARQKALENPVSGGRGPAVTGFGALAVNYSDEPTSRYRGGDIGWLELGNFNYHWSREVLQAGYALENGKMSDLIETQTGWYVVMKTDVRDQSVTPFEQVSTALRTSLLVQKRHQLEETFQQEAHRLAGVQREPQALAEIAWPPTPIKVAKTRELEPPPLPGSNPPVHDN